MPIARARPLPALAALAALALGALAPRRTQAESPIEAARATGHLLADDDLVAQGGLWSAPIEGGGLAVSTRLLLLRATGEGGPTLRWQAELTLQLPLDRLLGGRPRGWRAGGLSYTRDVRDVSNAPSSGGEASMEPSSKRATGWVAVVGALAIAPAALGKEPLAVVPLPTAPKSATASASASASASAPATVTDSAPPTTLTPQALRTLIAWALRSAGLDRDEALDALAARARASALAPELRLRALRGIDAGARVYRTDDLADRMTATDGTTTLLEGRLAWRLDRLVFADEEIALERLRLERAEQRQRLTARIIELALRWQRARRAAADPEALAADRAAADATALEALLSLDALTSGGATTLLAGTALPGR